MIYKDGFLNEYFLDKEITLQDSTWSIDGLIQEHRLRAFDNTAEAVAVFHCLELEPNPGTEGILKIRASISGCDELENRTVNYLTEQELQNLQVLTNGGCSSAPKLLAEAMFTQTEDMCDPGGYVMCIVMEALPGVPLDPNEFWKFDREKRDRIRKAFQLALIDVGDCGVDHWDTRIQNILWNEEEGICYIVDFENAQDITGTNFEWNKYYWRIWGLSHQYGGPGPDW